MSLTPSIFPAEFKDFILGYISLDENFEPIYTNGQIAPSVGDYPSAFAESYETYSISGEVPGALHGLQEPSILEAYLRTFSTSPMDFATALAEYWFTVLIVPGAPAHGGVEVVDVVNDATAHVDKFYDAIVATFTSTLATPVFINLINNIETIALPNVTWTVTELVNVGGTLVPTDFLETIS